MLGKLELDGLSTIVNMMSNVEAAAAGHGLTMGGTSKLDLSIEGTDFVLRPADDGAWCVDEVRDL